MLCLRKEFVGRGGWDYQLDLEFINETKFVVDGFDHYFIHSRIESQSINGRYFKTFGRSKCCATIEDAVTNYLLEEEWIRHGRYPIMEVIEQQTEMVRRNKAWLTI